MVKDTLGKSRREPQALDGVRGIVPYSQVQVPNGLFLLQRGRADSSGNSDWFIVRRHGTSAHRRPLKVPIFKCKVVSLRNGPYTLSLAQRRSI